MLFQQTERTYAQFAGTTEHMLPGLTAMYAQFASAVNKQQQFSSAVQWRLKVIFFKNSNGDG